MRRLTCLVVAVALGAACSSSDGPVAFDAATSSPSTSVIAGGSGVPDASTAPTTTDVETANDVSVTLDLADVGAPISPLIRGVSGAGTGDLTDVDSAYLDDIGATVNSWGGNTSTRYNYVSGHFWNSARDFKFQNGTYNTEGDSAAKFLALTRDAQAAARLAVPTLGWVARDGDPNSCSFRTPASECTAPVDASCSTPGPIAIPQDTSVVSTSAMVRTWVQGLVAAGLAPQYVAMDNEPELWGYTHYDIHPACPTYEEIRDKYIEYATALRDVLPDAQFMGPVMCCWYSFRNSAPGPSTGVGERDFLTWFLQELAAHDAAAGQRTLDMLDVHYYPESGVFNPDVDPETSARRLRSTRSLYDPGYADESWIGSRIALIPRLKQAIDDHYPGTKLGISEWNFGADQDINGALAIADVLGIYGREGVDFACYWRYPAKLSPGYFAFKMHGNYDGAGASFTGDVVPAVSSDIDRIGSFAALDATTGTVRVMLINKDPSASMDVHLDLGGAVASEPSRMFRYSPDDLTSIVATTLTLESQQTLQLPPSSISVLEMQLG